MVFAEGIDNLVEGTNVGLPGRYVYKLCTEGTSNMLSQIYILTKELSTCLFGIHISKEKLVVNMHVHRHGNNDIHAKHGIFHETVLGQNGLIFVSFFASIIERNKGRFCAIG